MRVLILTPTALPTVTGNAMTAERWRHSLTACGLAVEVLATSGQDSRGLVDQVHRVRPDLIHVHHAYRAGSLLYDPLLESSFDGLPAVISPGGTDIYLDARAEDRRKVITRVFGRADAIVVQSQEKADRVREIAPELERRIHFVPKSFLWLGQDAFDLREASGCHEGNVLFFLPAGIRPVKGNLECLLALEKVFAMRPRLRVVFAGPSLDPDYASRFEQEARRLQGFARWIDLIPPQSMRSAYKGADVVLNFSYSEGFSNVLLEARAAGKPVLVSDIPGNRRPVLGDNGVPPMGLFFDPSDPDDFVRQAVRLVDDEDLRGGLGRAARRHARQLVGPDVEAHGLLSVYESVLRTRDSVKDIKSLAGFR